MCKYRYEFFSYCGHQTFYLFDFCEKARIKAGASPNSSTVAYSDLSKDVFEQDSQSAQPSTAEVNSPEIINHLPSSGHSLASVQNSTETQEMSSKNLKSSVSSRVFKDSARILETCYQALEQSNNNESRQQPPLEGSPGFRSISRHAFEERLRFFESAVASPNTDISDTLSRFTYDSNTDTLYSLDLQLKRILEKAQILDHTSPEKSTVALSDLSNSSSRLNVAKNLKKGDKGTDKALDDTATFSPRKKSIDTVAASKASNELAMPDTSDIVSREKDIFHDVSHDIMHGVVRSPKATETRNTRKALPVQWLSRGKKTSCHDLRQPFKSEPSSPTKGDEERIPHSPSRKEASRTSTIRKAHKDYALSSKVDRAHAPPSPIASKAPNLRTAERAAARGLKRGQTEITSEPSPRTNLNIIKSRDRHIRGSPLSPVAVERGSPSSPRMHLEDNTCAKESRKSNTGSNRNNEGTNFTFSSSFSCCSSNQNEHRRRKSSITSTSSTNPVFYSAPQSPLKLQAINFTHILDRPSGSTFEFAGITETATSTDCKKRALFTGERNLDKLNRNDIMRSIPQSQNSPRKRPKLRVQTSFVKPYATSADISEHSATLPEELAVDSVLGTKEVQSLPQLAQAEDAHEISSCTAEPASSTSQDSHNSWQSCPTIEERNEPDATEQVELSSVDDRELSLNDYGERKSSENSFSLASKLEETSGMSKCEEEKNFLQHSESNTYPYRDLHLWDPALNENIISCVSPKTLQSDTCILSPQGPMVRDIAGHSYKKSEDYLFISPAIIISPENTEKKGDDKIVVEMPELSDVESKIKFQLSRKTESVIDNKESFLGRGESKEFWEISDMNELVKPVGPGLHASFASRLKATAPDFVPQNVNASEPLKKASKVREHTDEALKKVEPFAYQMDLLSAQLQKQAIDPNYALYSPFFGGLPQLDPFYMPSLNTYESLPDNKRYWQKYKNKSTYKKANGARMQQCHSPVPSIGAFRDDENATQWVFWDSTLPEQPSHGADKQMLQMEDGNARHSVQSGNEERNRTIPKLGFESFATPKKLASRGSADKRNGLNDYIVTVEPCDKIIVDKASEHVGGLPCRTCYPDYPASGK